MREAKREGEREREEVEGGKEREREGEEVEGGKERGRERERGRGMSCGAREYYCHDFQTASHM